MCEITKKYGIDMEVPICVDYGTRLSFGTEAKKDIPTGRGRYDLLPLEIIQNLLNFITNLLKKQVVVKIGVYKCISNFQKTGCIDELYGAIAEPLLIKWGNEGNFLDALTEKEIKKLLAELIQSLAVRYEQGAAKYGERNWEKGLPIHCYIDSALRHYNQYFLGMEDEPHLICFVWNIIAAIYTYSQFSSLDDFTLRGIEENGAKKSEKVETDTNTMDLSENENTEETD